MDITLYKDNRNIGKFYHKVPRNINSYETKQIACRDITLYIKQNDDFGRMNYIHTEHNIVTKLNPYTTYVFEDLY